VSNHLPGYGYLHTEISLDGGFLQTGSPNDINPARLIGETNLKCVIIAPVYRLAILGFLSSGELSQEAAKRGEPSGNQGFWDQRIALEWAYEYAPYFGGNESNITVAGYSAGVSLHFTMKKS
jgi:carboxylesterase type B